MELILVLHQIQNFLREGSAVDEFENPKKIVIGIMIKKLKKLF